MPSANLFDLSSTAILHLPAGIFIGADPVYPATISARAIAETFGGVNGLGVEV